MTKNTERARGRSLRPLRALWPYLVPYWRRLIFAAIVLIVAAVAMLAIPVATRLVIDEGFGNANAEYVNRYFLLFFAVAVVFGLFAALRFYLVIWLGERVVADLRRAVYSRIIKMDASFFEETKTGEVLSRLTTDTTLVQSIAGAGLSIALRSSLTLIGGLGMLLYTNPRLTVYMLACMPVILIPLLLIGRRIRKLSNRTQEKIADSSGLADETLNAIQTVQAYTLERAETTRFDTTIESSFVAAVKRIRARAAMTAMGISLVFGAITGVVWLGSQAVLGGNMTAGQLSEFVIYGSFVGMAAASLSELWGEIMRAAGAMDRIAELLTIEPAIKAPANPVSSPLKTGLVEFDRVRFCYPSRPTQPALDGLSLKIEPGETVAFVGPSGAGKSTLFQLLLRFYDPNSGAISIDGVDIKSRDPVQLRQAIGLVAQETVLFGRSALDNIRVGLPNASDEAVRAAAQQAAAETFISALPEGYDTFLGERGMRLSGGQRQRIAIARAFLKNPRVLLLDEATSALDSESEALIQSALARLREGRTTLIIAHRLATVQSADRIVVMDRARIQAVGTHQSLLADNALYARLAALQFDVAKTSHS